MHIVKGRLANISNIVQDSDGNDIITLTVLERSRKNANVPWSITYRGDITAVIQSELEVGDIVICEVKNNSLSPTIYKEDRVSILAFGASVGLLLTPDMRAYDED